MKKILEIHRGMRVLALVFLSGLCACGQKGPLYLAPAAASAPAPATAASAPAAASAAEAGAMRPKTP